MLNNVPFNTQDPPSYEALSYAWGSNKNPACVTVGEAGSDTIAVTRNLAAALKHLRHRDDLDLMDRRNMCESDRLGRAKPTSSINGQHIPAGRLGYRMGRSRGR
jgi:hypothetical protein